MKAIISIICLLFAGNAIATCEHYIHLTEIPYEKNSSYFPSQYAKQLDELMASTLDKPGYLLLEFEVSREQADEEIRKYNMWLANRRIERIKNYLVDSDYARPVISRILTASNASPRNVSITWCADTQSRPAARVAAANKPATVNESSEGSVDSENTSSTHVDTHEVTAADSR